MAEPTPAAVGGMLQQQKKRKRLNAVLDKISNHLNSRTTPNNNPLENNNMQQEDEDHQGMSPLARVGRTSSSSSAALRRERWRDNQQQSVEEQMIKPPLQTTQSGEVFKFDSFDRDRYLSGGSGRGNSEEVGHTTSISHLLPTSSVEESSTNDPDLFSPASGRSPHSSLSSPQVSVDSPRICFSPLRIKDSIEEEDNAATATAAHLPRLSVRACEGVQGGGVDVGSGGAAATNAHWLLPNKPGSSLSRPISPHTPLQSLPSYLTDAYRRRCLSDTDLSSGWEPRPRAPPPPHQPPHQPPTAVVSTVSSTRYLSLPAKGGSLESEASSSQESPLDLSVRGSHESVHPSAPGVAPSCVSAPPPSSTSRARGKSLGRSSRTMRSDERFSLDRLELAVVETSQSSSSGDVAFVCPICGQMFSLSDRLAKHMASRHKSRSTDGTISGAGSGGSAGGSGGGSKAYLCDMCKRSFARSDMLTRHMRLHTGIKPYTCRICGQVFSRSDHLSTHQRTHTGEKPYRCPSCPYAACRRDMITRHMRTHARYELQDSLDDPGGGGADSPLSVTSRSVSSESAEPQKPPSPMDTEPKE